jgi:hypothetical protein
MADEFKLAGAYVEIKLRDNTSGDEKRIRARLEGESAITWDTALNDPKNTEIVKKKVSSGKPVQISADLDDKLAQAKADEFVAKRRSAVIDLDANIAKLRTKLEELNKKRGTSVEVDADIRKAEAELAALVTRRRTVQLEVHAKTRPAEDEVSRMAARANAQFDALKFTGLSVGLPAAAAIGAVGVVGALAIAGGAFAALGIYAAANTKDVAEAVGSLSDRVQTDVRAMAEPVQGELVAALGDAGHAWDRLEPQVAAAVGAAAPLIRTMTGAATDFAEGAMPGMLASVRRAGPVFEGFRSFADSAGKGLGSFFDNASQGSEGAQQGFTILGGTVQLLEGRLGTLFANLANGSAGPLSSLHVIVDQATGALTAMTASGSGVIGFLQGASSSASGMVSVISLLAQGLSLLPPSLTQLGGSITATAMLANKFGLDATAGFDGFGKSVKEAEGTTNKFKAVGSGLMSGFLNPATLAVGALGIGLSILGDEQEKAARYASQHADNVRQLTDAIRADNGALGENVQRVNLKALADKNASSNLAAMGSSLGDAKLAIEGNSDAYDRLNYSGRAVIAGLVGQVGVTGDAANEYKDLATEALSTGKSYEQLSGHASDFIDTMVGGSKDAAVASLNALGAVGEQIKGQEQARQAYEKSESALTGLTQAQVRARDATAEHTAAIYDQQNAELGYRGAVLNTKQAMDDYTKTQQNGKASADDKARAELGLEQAMSAQEQAAYKAAYASSTATTENGKQAAATLALNQETVNLANAFNGPLPQSLQATIGKMSLTEAQAAGLKTGVNNAGQAVYQLPNGKDIVITSNAAKVITDMQRIRDAINAIPTTKKSQVEIVTIYKQVGTAATRTGANAPDVYLYGPHSATGGLITHQGAQRYADGAFAPIGGGLLSGPGGPRQDLIPAWLSNGEFVMNAMATAKYLPDLLAMNRGQTPNTDAPSASVQTAPRTTTASGATITNHITINTTEADPQRVASVVSGELGWAMRGV